MSLWSRGRLGDLSRVIGGTTPSTSYEGNFAGDVVWVTPADLGKMTHPSITRSDRMITTAARLRASMEILPPGTVVMSSRAPIGYLGVAGVGLCTNQGCKSFVPGPQLDPWFLYFSLRFQMGRIRALGAGATFAEVSKSELERFEILFPPIEDQRRIAADLSQQLRVVGSASRKAVDRTHAIRSLGLTILTNAFADLAKYPPHRLGDVASTRRSPSVSSDGDATVTTVTSGCLTPMGFSFDGLGNGRMSLRDAVAGIVNADEVLVARSNTEAFVGRASKYPGGEKEIVASDLVFRLAADPNTVIPDYLANYLAALQLSGYWRDRSSGASSTMKKITKSLLLDVAIPIPPLDEQFRIVGELHERLEATSSMQDATRLELEAIAALPSAILRRAFEDVAA